MKNKMKTQEVYYWPANDKIVIIAFVEKEYCLVEQADSGLWNTWENVKQDELYRLGKL